MLAERLAEYAKSVRYANLPLAVVHEVKRRLVDSFACAYGAMTASPCKIARRLALQVSLKDGATVWGTRHRTTPELAAFANGSLVRYLDYNDTYLSKEPAHPSDNIPACLAVAESLQANGRQLIQAIVLAYEVQCRLCDASALRPRGWDHVTYGAFSTSVAIAKLLNLSKGKTIHAINLAGITAGALRQTRVGEVSFWKACAFANSSRNGIFASYAAREGMTGPAAMFEGEKGFMQIVSGSLTLPEFGGENGAPYKILGTYIKPRPLEYHAQSAVEAAFDVRQQIRTAYGAFHVDHIENIEVGSFDVAIEIIGRDPEKWHPKTRETADHSLPFCVAVSLADGKISPQSFTRKRFEDKAMLAFMQKVKIKEVKFFTERYPSAMPTKIVVRMKGGRKFTAQVDHPRGHPKRPLSDHDLEVKFHSLADRKIGEKEVTRFIQRIWELEGLDDVKPFVSAMPVLAKGL